MTEEEIRDMFSPEKLKRIALQFFALIFLAGTLTGIALEAAAELIVRHFMS